MNIRTLTLGALVACALFTGPALADPATTPSSSLVTIDLSKIDDDTTRHAIVDALKAQKPTATTPDKPAVTIDNAKKWADIGKGIGGAIAETCRALSIGVNDFIKTPAGLLTVFVLIFYLFGASFWGVFAGTIIWIVVGSLIWRSFKKFHMPQKLVDRVEEGGKVTSTERFESFKFEEDGWRIGSVFAHGIAFAAISIISLCYIL